MTSSTNPIVGPGDFVVSTAEIIGKRHAILGKNGQDAIAVARTDNAIVAIAADGCGSGRYTEVGARLAVQWLASRIVRADGDAPAVIAAMEYPFASFLRGVGVALSGYSLMEVAPAVVQNYLLFTVLGAVVTPARTVVFGLGDGVYRLNGSTRVILPGSPHQTDEERLEKNAPRYFAYRLVGSSLLVKDPGALSFEIHENVPTADLNSLLIGTDGLEAFIPGRSEYDEDLVSSHGDLGQFDENPVYARRPRTGASRLFHKRLRVMGGRHKDCAPPKRYRFGDDVAAVLVRRATETA